MTFILSLVFVLSSFLGSLVMTAVLGRLSSRLALVTAPNSRSFHSIATPRGGGLAIAVVTIAAACFTNLVPGGATWALVDVLAGTALLGFLDDLNDLSAAPRFPIQALLIALAIYIFTPLPDMYLFECVLVGGLVLSAIVLVSGLWA